MDQVKDSDLVVEIAHQSARISKELSKRIVGQKEVVEQLIISLFAGGHCLLVGVPGLAKTMLISTLADILALSFNRIQFTPDLMPSDITGTDILDEDPTTARRIFRFIKGPVFHHIILADEINRTPPKTQAALLQSMQEYTVTASGRTYQVERPFHVFATQNPIEQEGTYPLPEAQLDRFMFMVMIDYPDHNEEVEIVRSTTGDYQESLKKVMDPEKLLQIYRLVSRVPVSGNVIEYAVKLVRATRPSQENNIELVNQYIKYGAGPRASQYLILASKARAVLKGRFTVAEEDIKALAHPVLRHRIITNFRAGAESINTDSLVDKIIEET